MYIYIYMGCVGTIKSASVRVLIAFHTSDVKICYTRRGRAEEAEEIIRIIQYCYVMRTYCIAKASSFIRGVG